MLVNIDPTGRASVEQSWNWKAGKFDSGVGDASWMGLPTFNIIKSQQQKIFFVGKREVRKIPAVGEGWRLEARIPSTSARVSCA